MKEGIFIAGKWQVLLLSACYRGAEFVRAVLEMGIGFVAESDSVTTGYSYVEGGIKPFLQQCWALSPTATLRMALCFADTVLSTGAVSDLQPIAICGPTFLLPIG